MVCWSFFIELISVFLIGLEALTIIIGMYYPLGVKMLVEHKTAECACLSLLRSIGIDLFC